MTTHPEEPVDLTKPSSGGEPTLPLPGQQPPSPYAAPPSPYVGPPAYTPYGQGAPGYPFAQAHSGANVSMGLGIASVVCAILTVFCCFTAPGVFAGPFAIALGVRARTQMQERPGAYNNEGAALAGLITGIVGTVLGLAMIALVVFVVGTIFSFS